MGYRCRYVSGEVRLSDEHVSYRWVGREDYEDVDDGSAPFEALRRCFEMGLCSPGDAEADLRVCSYIFLDAGVRVPLLICA